MKSKGIQWSKVHVLVWKENEAFDLDSSDTTLIEKHFLKL